MMVNVPYMDPVGIYSLNLIFSHDMDEVSCVFFIARTARSSLCVSLSLTTMTSRDRCQPSLASVVTWWHRWFAVLWGWMSITCL